MRVLVMGGLRFTRLATVRQWLPRGHGVTEFNRGTRAVEWPGPVIEVHGDRHEASALAQLGRMTFDGGVDLSAHVAVRRRAAETGCVGGPVFMGETGARELAPRKD
jgi:hypothetical protein